MASLIRLEGKIERHVIVDDADFEWLSRSKWYFEGRRYAARMLGIWPNRRWEFMHRLLVGTPPGFETDHINCNGLDNRRANLRVCSASQNQQNRPAPRNNTSGVRGVSYTPSRNTPAKWKAEIFADGKHFFLGWYRTCDEAKVVREVAEIRLFGEFRYHANAV